MRLKKRSKPTIKRKTPKYVPKSKKAKKIRRRLKKTIREKAERYGFRLVQGINSDRALREVDSSLSQFVADATRELPLDWNIRTHFNRDGSVDGEAKAVGDVSELDGGWDEAFGRMSEFNLWPRAIHQTEDHFEDRNNGAFFFSIRWEFKPPKGANFRELDARYERIKGGFATQTYWHFTDTAAQEIAGHAAALTEALEQNHYGYDVTSITVRLHWSPTGRKPQFH
jgi:hypothetical protein